MHVKGNISVNNTSGAAAAANNTNEKVISKNCAPFTSCISKINNTQIDNVEYIDIVIPMYNLIEFSDNYSKTTGSLWQYCKDIPAVNDNVIMVILLFLTELMIPIHLILKSKIIGKTNDDGDIENVEIMVPLKYLSNFWRTLEMSLINCEVELILAWSKNRVLISTSVANQNPKFTIIETDLHVPVVTLSAQDNPKLLPQLKSSFKKTISWNKYLSKPELLAQNANLNHLTEPSFQGKLFVLAFENDVQ